MTILVTGYVLLHVASVLASDLTVVSLKALVVKLAYVFVFYYMAQVYLAGSVSSYVQWIVAYAVALAGVVLYSLANHYPLGMTSYTSGYVSVPFYTDHTIYAAALAFVLPCLVALLLKPRSVGWKSISRIPIGILFLLLLAGLFYSFSRAAWISLFVSMAVGFLLLIGLRFRSLLILSVIGLVMFYSFRMPLVDSFQKNRINSDSITATPYDQLLSVTNITNDVSNAERLNRWSCAYRMAVDKPWLGYGPGTFQFVYLGYQRPEEMTSISVRIPVQEGSTIYTWTGGELKLPSGVSVLQGDRGTAHSEYFLAMSETGFPSLVFLVGILTYALSLGIRIVTSSREMIHRITGAAALFGIITYGVHGLFNNFLDDCKLAFLFWSSLGILATLYNRDRGVDDGLQPLKTAQIPETS